MREEKIPFSGVLYAGIIKTQTGIFVLEYNARFGDPETQTLMMLLWSDLYPIIKGTSEGSLQDIPVIFKKGASICVVLSSEGYPQKPSIGDRISINNFPKDPNIQLFHAGTIWKNNNLETSGGRVIGVAAYANTLEEASKKAYSRIGDQGINFREMHFRKDLSKYFN